MPVKCEPDAVFCLDSEGSIVYADEAGCLRPGCRSVEAKSFTFNDLQIRSAKKWMQLWRPKKWLLR